MKIKAEPIPPPDYIEHYDPPRTLTADDMVAQLEAAAKAYYETEVPIMTDLEYDTLLEDLRKLAPSHPFLKKVGCMPIKEPVELPCPMPSLKKIKPDTVSTWRVRGPFVISDKLDGISALWVPGTKSLYLRGNGLIGQDMSRFVPHIRGLKEVVEKGVMVRGELIVPRGVVASARNWVNGVLHQEKPSVSDLERIHFVAYQVVKPRMTRSQQMRWLSQRDFFVVPWSMIQHIDVAELQHTFVSRRGASPYECDGLVIGQEILCDIPATDASEPKDCVAFKMPVDSQRAETTVVAVEWASSKGGLWIPRVRVEPVKIGTVTIEWCTGHSAKFISNERIGPGARVVVRRSGDVIPILEQVLKGADVLQMPPEGRWEWDGAGTHAKDISQTVTDEKCAQMLTHTITTLGVEGYSQTSLLKVVKGGIRYVIDLLNTTEGRLQEILGPTLGPRLLQRFREAIQKASPEQWVEAWTMWPRGFGRSRITSMLEVAPQVSDWVSLKVAPAGMSEESLERVQECVPAYIQWFETFKPFLSGGSIPKYTPKGLDSSIQVKGYVVFSGFRDTALQSQLVEKGWVVTESVSAKTTAVLVPDEVAESGKETTKTKSARAIGAKVLAKSKALTLLEN